jgi:hypothetical protein
VQISICIWRDKNIQMLALWFHHALCKLVLSPVKTSYIDNCSSEATVRDECQMNVRNESQIKLVMIAPKLLLDHGCQ